VTLSYHSYTTAKHFAATATFYLYTVGYSINNLRFAKIRVSWNGELPLSKGLQPFAIAGRITSIYMKYGRQ